MIDKDDPALISEAFRLRLMLGNRLKMLGTVPTPRLGGALNDIVSGMR